jgi:uncharacterized protein YcfL
MNRGLTKLAVVALATALCGCARTVNTVEIPSQGENNWIRTDPELSRVAELSHVRKARAGDKLRVQVDVTNRTDDEVPIWYRFIWMDSNGMTFDSPVSSWQRRILQGGQQVSLGGVAPEASVTDCRLEMQRTAPGR